MCVVSKSVSLQSVTNEEEEEEGYIFLEVKNLNVTINDTNLTTIGDLDIFLEIFDMRDNDEILRVCETGMQTFKSVDENENLVFYFEDFIVLNNKKEVSTSDCSSSSSGDNWNEKERLFFKVYGFDSFDETVLLAISDVSKQELSDYKNKLILINSNTKTVSASFAQSENIHLDIFGLINAKLSHCVAEEELEINVKSAHSSENWRYFQTPIGWH